MSPTQIPDDTLDSLIRSALHEDLGMGDVTVNALIPPELEGEGRIVAKEEGVIYGIEPARRIFKTIDESLSLSVKIQDGRHVKPGDLLISLQGRVASLLKAERTALNFLQHLSGIATFTARFVKAVKGTKARILDTRKTIPNLRLLEKGAVHAGGGENHRIGLFDMVLIKDNHLEIMKGRDEAAQVRQAVERALASVPAGMKVQVEVTSLEGALEAGRSGAHMVLLDNMSPEQMAKVVKAFHSEWGDKRPLTEASGGVTLDNVQEVAAAGVDRISVGALTHSAPALDLSMYIEPTRSD